MAFNMGSTWLEIEIEIRKLEIGIGQGVLMKLID